MKILYFFAQYDTPMYLWQNTHIVDELKHHGIDIEVFNPLHFENLEQANEEVLTHLKKRKYDLFMTCETHKVCFCDTVEAVKTAGIPTLLYCFDSLMTPLNHKIIAPYFDVVMISQYDRKGVFASYNPNVIVSHYAANPFFFQMKEMAENLSIGFPGTPYGSRMVEIKKLADAGIPLSLFYNAKTNIQAVSADAKGSLVKLKDDIRTACHLLRYEEGRKVISGAIVSKLKRSESLNTGLPNVTVGGAVSLQETNDIYASHALALSVGVGRSTGYLKNPIQIVHLRNFEIPMSGGVQFCQYFEELSECFEENKEIIFYRTEEEMIDKAWFYLRPEQAKARTAIRQAARKRAEAEHTWFCRFSKAFDLLGLIAEG